VPCTDGIAREGLHGLGRKPGIVPTRNREERCLLRVTSNQFATVALMSAFPESDRQPPQGTPTLWAMADMAGTSDLGYDFAS
jgi:hypothetical protein